MPSTLSPPLYERVRPYVSNLDRPVFAVRNLPEEVIAVLLAYYSRSRDDLRTNLARLLAEDSLAVVAGAGPHAPATTQSATDQAQQHAARFHQKWVIGYGHSSVAEHAVIHLAAEGVSIVASKVIEDLRLGSFTEKSTRYVVFDTDSFVEPTELSGERMELYRTLYRTTCNNLFATYLNLFPRAQAGIERLLADTPKPRSDAVATSRSKTCDLLRGLLPASTRTNLGITTNARALATLLRKMLSHPLGEVQSLGAMMQAEASDVAPTLVRHVAASEYLRPNRERLQPVPASWVATPSTAFDACASRDTAGVRVVHYDADALARIVLALSYNMPGTGDAPSRWRRIITQDSLQLVRIVQQALASRGEHEPAPRAFEAVHVTLELQLDYGAYRDLQRHRMLSPATQVLGCDHGAEVAKELELLGLREDFVRALEQAGDAWKAMAKADPWVAQYVVPLAYRVRALWTLNLREALYIVELRSRKQGHPSYRRIAQQMYGVLCELYPWFESVARVDHSRCGLLES